MALKLPLVVGYWTASNRVRLFKYLNIVVSCMFFSLSPRTQQTRPKMVQDARLSQPQGSPSMSRIYRLNIQPIVIAGAFFIMLWSITCGSTSYRNVPYFKAKHNTNLAVIYNIMASIYMGVVVIEVFGIFAAAKRGAGYVRIYAYLSILATFMVAAAGLIQMGVYYIFKNTILDLCNVKVGEDISFPGFFGPIVIGIGDLSDTVFDSINQSDVEGWCRGCFDHDSLSNVIALPVAACFAALLIIFVFAYVRRLRGPTSVDKFSRESVCMDADEFVSPPPRYEG